MRTLSANFRTTKIGLPCKKTKNQMQSLKKYYGSRQAQYFNHTGKDLKNFSTIPDQQIKRSFIYTYIPLLSSPVKLSNEQQQSLELLEPGFNSYESKIRNM